MSASRGAGPARPSGTSSGKDEAQNSPSWPSVSSIHSCRTTPGPTAPQDQQQQQQQKCRNGVSSGPRACSSLRMSGACEDRRMMPPPTVAPTRIAPGELALEEQQLQVQPRVKHFSRWRVVLNDDRELLVKGTAHDGTTIRSRAITSVISANQVRSGNRFIYELHGGIADDHRVLPNYIRQKFAEGFPNDWQNVHRLWVEYLAAKPSSNFRWPTDFNDVDDDIQSVVTEYSFFPSKGHHNHSNISPTSDSNHSSLGYHSKIQSDNNQELEKSKPAEKSKEKFLETDNRIKKSEHSKGSDAVSDVRLSEEKYSNKASSLRNHTSENTDSTSSILSSSFCLTKFFSEDNRKIIFDVLSDGCPPEMMDKFLAMIDFLRFIVTKKDSESDVYTDSRYISKSNSQSCLRCDNSEMSNASETQDSPSTKKLKEMRDKQGTVDINANESSESSDNDALLGVPNLILDHLLKPPRSKFSRARARKIVNGNKTSTTSHYLKHCKVSNHNSSVSVLENDPDETRKNECKQADGTANNFDLNQLVQSKDQNNCANNERSTKDNGHKPKLKSIVAVQMDLSCVNNLKRQSSYGPSTVHKETTDLMKKQKLMNVNTRGPDTHEGDDEGSVDNLLKHKFFDFDSEDYLEENQMKLLPNKYNNEKFKQNFKVGKSICKDKEVSRSRSAVVCSEKKERKPLQLQFSSNSSDSDREPHQINQVPSRMVPRAFTQKLPAVEKKPNPARRPKKKRNATRKVAEPENGRYNMRLRNRMLKAQPGVEWTYDTVQNQKNQLSDCEDL